MGKNYEITKRKGNLALFGIVFFFIAGYIFFFSSTMWMPSNLAASLQTPLKENVQWGERTLQIRRWDYCETEQVMEVEIDMDNKSFDGKNHYQYSAINRNYDQLKVVKMIEDSDWIVLRIENVTDNFGEISLRIDMMGEPDDNTLKLYTNVNAVKRVKDLEKRDRKGYQLLRLQRDTESYQKEISTLEKNKKSLLEKNQRMQEEINHLQSEESYQTEEMKAEQTDKINEIQSEITANQDEIQSYDLQLKEKRERIELIKKQMTQ